MQTRAYCIWPPQKGIMVVTYYVLKLGCTSRLNHQHFPAIHLQAVAGTQIRPRPGGCCLAIYTHRNERAVAAAAEALKGVLIYRRPRRPTDGRRTAMSKIAAMSGWDGRPPARRRLAPGHKLGPDTARLARVGLPRSRARHATSPPAIAESPPR